MSKKEAPAEVALGSGAGLGKQVAPLDHTKNHANALAANVVPLNPSLRHCPFCGFWLLRGTVMEALHGNRCPKMEQHRREEARREALRQEIDQWRRADRERLRKARGVPIRKPSAPLPPPRPAKAMLPRLKRLHAALADPMMHVGLVALSQLPVDALERVAAGRSTMTRGRWRRVEVLIGRAGK